MKKLFIVFAALFITLAAHATEVITIYSPYTPTHRGHAAIYKILEKANLAQTRYKFVLELKPGAAGVTALKAMDNSADNSLAIIHASFVQNILDGSIQEQNYVPISSLGDACWFIVSKFGDEKLGFKSLTTSNEKLMFGGVGVGSASHLTSIEIGTTINREILFIPFNSAADAAILLVGNHEVNLGIMDMNAYQSLATKNPNLKRLGIHCNRRHPEAKWVQTTREQGINSPYVFNTFVASVNLSSVRQKEFASIIDQAILDLGADQILEMSAFHPPVFDRISVIKYHQERIALLKTSIAKNQSQIDKYRGR